jgi:hypothetical protein
MNKKQWIKIATLSAPIIALVIATLAGLDANAQNEIQEVILSIITIVAGAIGVGGVVANNDKNENE